MGTDPAVRDGFLVTQWWIGALYGATAAEALYVPCDCTTMTQDDIDNGRLICDIGIAPVKPAEFVMIRIQQETLMIGPVEHDAPLSRRRRGANQLPDSRPTRLAHGGHEARVPGRMPGGRRGSRHPHARQVRADLVAAQRKEAEPFCRQPRWVPVGDPSRCRLPGWGSQPPSSPQGIRRSAYGTLATIPS